MSAWWWIPIGLAAWFAVAVVTALIVGPVLAGGSPQATAGRHGGTR